MKVETININVDNLVEQVRSPIVELNGSELKPGVIWNRFRDGAKAVRLVGDSRIASLWNKLIIKQFDSSRAPFWEKGIFNFALNHGRGQKNVGDMWCFVPGNIAYVARKIIIYPEPNGSRFLKIPKQFWQEDDSEIFTQETLELAWDLVTEVFKSSVPHNFKLPPYGVSIQFLKYPDSMTELDRVFTLLNDSGADKWALVGKNLDLLREMASGPFKLRWIRDIFALGSLVPGLSQLLQKINNSFIHNKNQALAENLSILGSPHIDSTRVLTMLASERDMISTDIFDGSYWHELPIDTNSLFIFPGKLFSKELKLEPTLHRYSIKTGQNQSAVPKKNLSLLLGPVDLESCPPLSKFFI